MGVISGGKKEKFYGGNLMSYPGGMPGPQETGPNKPCPPGTDCSEDDKSIENYKQDQDLVFNNQALNEVTVSAPVINEKNSKKKKTKGSVTVYKSKVGKVLGDLFGKNKNKSGQKIRRNSDMSTMF